MKPTEPISRRAWSQPALALAGRGRGFTLIEMLVVMTLIALLLTLAVIVTLRSAETTLPKLTPVFASASARVMAAGFGVVCTRLLSRISAYTW